jgi:hypothetical protein
VAVASGVFCIVEVLLRIFFDALRAFGRFLCWIFDFVRTVSLALAVTVCSYGIKM